VDGVPPVEHTTHIVIKKASFKRLVHKIANDFKPDVLFQHQVVKALQTAADAYLRRRRRLNKEIEGSDGGRNRQAFFAFDFF
ncbi:histone H3, partial [Corchorus capsularis]